MIFKNYGGSPLYQGITNLSVSDSLGNLCNDFCEGESLAEDIIAISPVFDEREIGVR
jgi:hypothetical protein